MERDEPLLFKEFPNLKRTVPWIPILTHVPTVIERLIELENYIGFTGGELYIKRDDKNHHIYGGNKLRKFEFIFGKAIKKKKKGIVTIGGVGTNHGAACAILCRGLKPPIDCKLYLFPQPITWHVQRSLLLYDFFGAKLHLSGGDVTAFIRAILFRCIHPKYYFMFPGGSPLFGFGTSLGTLGFINAVLELKEQIDQGIIPEPDIIFIAGGSTGTSAGLIAGCKILGLKTKVYVVPVYADFLANASAVKRNANKALKFLRKRDKTMPKIKVTEDDFEFIKGYLGSGYGIKTLNGQAAVDLMYDLEGKNKGFKLETTYTGKTMAGMLDILKREENQTKKVLFWNTYNSNELDKFIKEGGVDYENLPKKFHQFFKHDTFQCWQITACPKEIREECLAYLNHEYRFWKITECSLDEKEREKAFKELDSVISLENT
ncbi:MAG: 1-aminocyclopropane-1-carboxylate deaminase/D-cysteine desulfhydrase [Promethearchaeota archaeon]|jgi:D-cysteine desulfhydrase